MITSLKFYQSSSLLDVRTVVLRNNMFCIVRFPENGSWYRSEEILRNLVAAASRESGRAIANNTSSISLHSPEDLDAILSLKRSAQGEVVRFLLLVLKMYRLILTSARQL